MTWCGGGGGECGGCLVFVTAATRTSTERRSRS